MEGLKQFFLSLARPVLSKPKPTSRLVVLGLDAAGKTTFLYQLKGRYGDVVTTIPTIGFNVETLEIQQTELICWDVGGCDKIRPLWNPFIQGLNALVFVVDSNDKDRFEESKKELDIFLREELCRNVPLLLIANKQDLLCSCSLQEVVDAFGLADVRDRLWYAQGASCIKRDGLRDCFRWLEATLLGNPPPAGLTGVASDHHLQVAAHQKVAIFNPSKIPSVVSNVTAEQELARAKEELKRDIERRETAMQEWLQRQDEPLDVFVAKVERCELESWDHYTHVRLGWAAVQLHGVEEGFRRLDGWISNFIARSGRTDGKSFHATMTRFWAHMIAQLMYEQHRYSQGCEGGADFKRFLAAHRDHARSVTSGNGEEHYKVDITNPGMYKRYYTSKAMFAPEARQRPARPDLLALPELFPECLDPGHGYDGPFGGHGHRCGKDDCPAAGTVISPGTFDSDRAFYRSCDYYLRLP